MVPVIFIHTNDKQILGAKVSAFSLRRAAQRPDDLEVRLIRVEEQPALMSRHGQSYLRNGKPLRWDVNDLQSFTPTRFLAPQLMGYSGRAIVIDPDVFAVGDVGELLSRDMQGKAIWCRKILPADGRPAYYASSVMLLDCAKLRRWQWEPCIERLFRHELDYHRWMNLLNEEEASIGLLEEEWNHFDTLNERTKLLHNTGRVTQPWKTGLPVDFVKHGQRFSLNPLHWFGRAPRGPATYRPHPDRTQEQFFFRLLAEAIEQGAIDIDFVAAEISRGHVRRDALDLLTQTTSQGATEVHKR